MLVWSVFSLLFVFPCLWFSLPFVPSAWTASISSLPSVFDMFFQTGVSVPHVGSSFSSHPHSDCPCRRLTFLNLCAQVPAMMAHFICCSDCSSPCMLSHLLFHSFPVSLFVYLPSSLCVLFTYSLPFSPLHYHPSFSPWLSWWPLSPSIPSLPLISSPESTPDSCSFCVTMRQMQAADSMLILVHAKQATQKMRWGAFAAPVLCNYVYPTLIQTLNTGSITVNFSPI